MLLTGNDGTGLLCFRNDEILIQRLDGVDVDNGCGDALSCQQLACCQSLLYLDTRCDQGYVRAIRQLHAAADLEFVVLIEDYRNSHTAETEIAGTLHLDSGLHSQTCFHSVGGIQNGHTGDGAHEGQILVALMGSAVLTDGDARVGSTDLHVGVRIADGVADLLIGAASRKHSEGGCKRDLAGQRKADSHVDHVVLSDTAIEETIGECLLEGAGLGSGRQIGVQNHQILILGTKFSQRVTVRFTGSNLFCHCPVPLMLSRQARA